MKLISSKRPMRTGKRSASKLSDILIIKITYMKQMMLSILACFLIVHGNAQRSELFAPGGTAINGYDAVAFFKESKPVKGSVMYSYQYKGATWLFSSKEDLDTFMKSPEKYEPQYGGYCAYGTSQGHKAPTQPDTWTIVNDKLYFNYNKQVKQMWVKDQMHLIEVADLKWPDVKLTKE
jgi:YHS domain-containing protein